MLLTNFFFHLLFQFCTNFNPKHMLAEFYSLDSTTKIRTCELGLVSENLLINFGKIEFVWLHFAVLGVEILLGFFMRKPLMKWEGYYSSGMKTQQHMGIFWTVYFIVMAILLGSSALVSSEETMKTEEVLFSQLVDPTSTSADIDLYMVRSIYLFFSDQITVCFFIFLFFLSHSLNSFVWII